jgi:hypothetical protein
MECIIIVSFWSFVLFIIWFLESYLGCQMDDCMGGYDEFTVWERIKIKFKRKLVITHPNRKKK